MNETLKTILQLSSGGAAGAVITAIINSLKNRIPKIDYNLSVEPLYNNDTAVGSYIIRIVFINPADESLKDMRGYENLFVLKAILTNISNKSFDKFSFGINFPQNMKPVLVTTKPQDRLHSIKSLTPIDLDPKKSSTELDFEITPFNRKEKAEINIFFNKENGNNEKPNIITSEEVKLVDKISRNEDLKVILSEISVPIFKGIRFKF